MKKRKSKMKKKVKLSKEALYVMKLIQYTERNIKNDGTGVDELFKGQAKRLKKQLENTK